MTIIGVIDNMAIAYSVDEMERLQILNKMDVTGI